MRRAVFPWRRRPIVPSPLLAAARPFHSKVPWPQPPKPAVAAGGTHDASFSSSASTPSGIVRPNALKRRLLAPAGAAAKPCAVGLMLAEINQWSIMPMLRNGGYEFVLIDAEHGPFGIETIASLSRAARQAGMTPIVRPPVLDYAWIAPVLDSGAEGIMAPRITHAAQVEQVVQMMKYPPWGIRGNAMSRGYCDFKAVADVSSVMRDANQETMLVVQIETKEAVQNLDEILRVKGVDAALIGPNDLSIALGTPGQQSSPIVEDAIRRTIDTCNKYNIIPAVHMNSLDLAVKWAKQGVRMVSYASDVGLIQRAALEGTSAVKAAFLEQQPKK